MRNRKTEIFAIFAVYFCIHAFNGITSPFLPLFLEDMGYDVTMRGILLSIGPVVAMLTQPMWGGIGDRSKNKSRTIWAMAAGMIVVTALYMLSYQKGIRSLLSGLPAMTVTSIFVLPALILYSFFQSPMQPMADTVTMEYIYQNRPGFKYGIARVMGTISFTIITYVTGVVIERSSGGTSTMFPIQMAVAVFMTLAMLFLPKMPGKQVRQEKTSAVSLFKDPWFLMITVMAFVIVTTMGFYVGNFSPYLRGQLHAGEKLIGLSSSVSALLEIFLFFVTHKIIRKTGILNLMLIDLLLVAIRWLVFAFTRSIAVIMLMQFLTQPFSWAIFSYTLSVFVQRAIEGKMHSRAQGILNGTALSFGRVLGTLGGSFAIRAVGETRQQIVFLGISVMCMVTLAVAVIVFHRLGWKLKKAPDRFALGENDAI
ncbi:MAG: MFS transporter [Clostridia bacterium]|nr:MFS transporter [Clostridia bacterium]